MADFAAFMEKIHVRKYLQKSRIANFLSYVKPSGTVSRGTECNSRPAAKDNIKTPNSLIGHCFDIKKNRAGDAQADFTGFVACPCPQPAGFTSSNIARVKLSALWRTWLIYSVFSLKFSFYCADKRNDLLSPLEIPRFTGGKQAVKQRQGCL
jgi:hypothetical protein